MTILSDDEHFVVATISTIRDNFKQLTEHRPLALQKLNSILKQSSSISKLIIPFAPQTPISKNRKKNH